MEQNQNIKNKPNQTKYNIKQAIIVFDTWQCINSKDIEKNK